MSLPWTEDQARAIKTLDRDVVVSAGAGTGKTAVLVEHALEILRGGTPPERLLVITFTRKAADQLREKLFEALSKSEPALRALLPLLPRAYISTIHSFCSRLLRESAVEAGLDPGFRVLDQTAIELLVKESIAEVLDQWYERALTESVDPRFGILVDLCQRLPDGVEGELRMLLDMARTTEDPQRAIAIFERKQDLPYREHFRRFAKEDLAHLRRCATALVEALGRQERLTKGAENLLRAARSLTLLPSAGRRFDDFWSVRQTLIHSGTISRKQNKWKQDLPQCRKLSGEAKAANQALKDALEHSVLAHLPESPEELASQESRISAFGSVLARLLREISESYEEKKRTRGVLDFADLELHTKAFLEEEDRQGIDPSRRYDHVLVDEFQDVNRLQARIIELLTSNNRRFLVGDIKQCIYQFRLSAPDIFRDLLRAPEPTHKKIGSQGDLFAQPDTRSKQLVVQVRDSFRSRAPILSFVNLVFAEVFKEETLGLAYDDQKLSPAFDYDREPDPPRDPKVSVSIIHRTPLQPAEEDDGEAPSHSNAEGNDTHHRSASEHEAMLVAKKILHLVQDERPRIWDKTKDEWREIRWGDVAVLLRGLRPTWGHTFLRVLREEGIPVHLGRGTGFFEVEEIRDAMNFLRVLDNAFNDVPLAALLRSPVFGWRDSDLAMLRHAYPDARYLWLALQEMAKTETQRLPSDVERILLGGPAEIPKKLQRRLHRISREAVEKLEDWRSRLGRGELESTLASIFHEAELPELVTAHPQGPLRQANLHRMLDLVQSYSRDHGHSLRGLLGWLDEVRLETEPLAQIPGEAEEGNTVRILSVHMAKGLEFPVVIIAQIGQRLPLYEHGRSPILGTPEGLGMDLLKPREFEKVPTLARWTLRTAKERTEVFEEMRVLYVAMTRARERLFLVGSVTSNSRLTEERSLPLSPRDLWSPQGRSPLTGWILPILAQHSSWPGNATLRSGDPPRGDSGSGEDAPWSLELHLASDLDSAFPIHPIEPLPSQTRDLVARGEPLPAPAAPPAEIEKVFAPIRTRYAVPRLREFQGRYWVTEFKRWTDHWREREALEEGSRLPAVRGEEGLSWSPSLLNLLGGAQAAEESAAPEPRELGQALHLLLEKLDLAVPAGKVTRGEPVAAEDLREEAEEILHRYGFRRTLVTAEGLRWICGFYNSDPGRALLESWRENPRGVQREVSFTMRLPLDELQRMLDRSDQDGALIQSPQGVTDLPDEWTLLQGQMDLLWRDAAGTWRLLDYKSDRVPDEGEMQKRVEAYTPQMQLYTEAVRQLWGAESLRSHLFFLRNGRAVEIG